jgi:hypothetical protein
MTTENTPGSDAEEQDAETRQTSIDPFREMNRYDDRHEDWPSDAVHEPPRRTLGEYWAKFHATRDCGARNVAFVENTTSRSLGPKWQYSLRCWDCGYRIEEDDILFIGGDWYSKHGWREYGKPLEDLHLPRERVLELGPDPDRDELVRALNLTRIEQSASTFGLTFGSESYYECEDCGQETFFRFDNRCRMCYDGEWTDRMQETVDRAVTSILERNDSFAHRLEREIDPLSMGKAYQGMILWRRNDEESVPKLVEVTQRFEDCDDGHLEYVLMDVTHTTRHQYHEDDLQDCFYDTGLRNDEPKPVMDDRIREVWTRVKDR